jgi:hypothetical protein
MSAARPKRARRFADPAEVIRFIGMLSGAPLLGILRAEDFDASVM